MKLYNFKSSVDILPSIKHCRLLSFFTKLALLKRKKNTRNKNAILSTQDTSYLTEKTRHKLWWWYFISISGSLSNCFLQITHILSLKDGISFLSYISQNCLLVKDFSFTYAGHYRFKSSQQFSLIALSGLSVLNCSLRKSSSDHPFFDQLSDSRKLLNP